MRKLLSVALLLLAVGACSTTQQGAVVGGALGAGTGAIIGHQSGHTATGALIGGGAGAAGGALIGEQLDTKFCPTCGKRFTSGKTNCPYDGTPLQRIQK